LLTDVRGFPLIVHAFDGNTAETRTILSVLTSFMAAHQLPQVTVVADAGMLSEANLAAIEDAGLSFIVGARIPDVPYQVREWQRAHPVVSRSVTGRSSPNRRSWAPKRIHGSGRSSTSTAPTGPAP
jgi:hypothetical protein